MKLLLKHLPNKLCQLFANILIIRHNGLEDMVINRYSLYKTAVRRQYFLFAEFDLFVSIR